MGLIIQYSDLLTCSGEPVSPGTSPARYDKMLPTRPSLSPKFQGMIQYNKHPVHTTSPSQSQLNWSSEASLFIGFLPFIFCQLSLCTVCHSYDNVFVTMHTYSILILIIPNRFHAFITLTFIKASYHFLSIYSLH